MADKKEIKNVSSFPVTLIIALILSVAIVIFAIENSQEISLKAFTWQTEISLALLLFITLGIGIIITILYSIPTWNKKRKVKNQLKKRLKELEGQIRALKEKESLTSDNEPLME